ncbi:MAG: phosphopantothenoylcysteine decarboxylase [Planctomycetota bacterium]|nr:MAG: phosphopantothenoylcysteine decarboxylase [Planctomycetota bacterium]
MTNPTPENPRPDPSELAGYEVVVGVCGGIAAYKVASLVSALVQRGAGVTVAMTAAAQKFITPLTFESLTARQVFTDLWHSENYHDPQHLNLTERADMFVIAPATANTIGRIAGGLADDLVSTMVMSADCPVLLAPAMNTRMWQNPIVQANLKKLVSLGYRMVAPGEGWLACRTIGAGRMAEPLQILAESISLLKQSPPRSKSR